MIQACISQWGLFTWQSFFSQPLFNLLSQGSASWGKEVENRKCCWISQFDTRNKWICGELRDGIGGQQHIYTILFISYPKERFRWLHATKSLAKKLPFTALAVPSAWVDSCLPNTIMLAKVSQFDLKEIFLFLQGGFFLTCGRNQIWLSAS